MNSHFEEIYLQHYESLYRYAFTLVKDASWAQDITQDAFLNYYRISIREGKRIQHPRAYLYRSVHNLSLKQISRNARNASLPEQLSAGQAYSPPQEEQIIDQHTRKEFYRMAYEILDTLPEQCRKVFEKSRLEQKKYEEIARELNISTKTVEGHISKALKLIRDFLNRTPQSRITLMLFILFICHP